MTGETNDFRLLDAWRAGDQSAGSELFERHFADLCRFFRHKIPDGVDDLVGSTLLACVEARDRFEERSSFRSYLFGIARLELLAHLRKRCRRPHIDPLATSAAELHPATTMWSAVAKRREQRQLLEALRQIPIDHQMILELFYWQDMSAREIAEVIGVPEGTARTRLRRARQLLSKALDDLEPGPRLDESIHGLEAWAASLREDR